MTWWGVCYLALLILNVWADIRWRRRAMNPWTMLLALIFACTGGAYDENGRWITSEQTAFTLGALHGITILILVGLSLARTRRPLRRSEVSPDQESRAARRLFWCLVGTAVATSGIVMVFWAGHGGVMHQISLMRAGNHMVQRGGIAAMDYSDSIVHYVGGLGIASFSLLPAALVRMRRVRHVHFAATFLSWVLTWVVAFSGGTRSVVLLTAACWVVLLLSHSRGRRYLPFLAVAGVAAALAVVVQTAYRSVGLNQGEMRTAPAFSLSYVLTDANQNQMVAFIVEHYPGAYEFTYGRSLVAVGLSWVPRALWPGKPISLGRELAWQAMGLPHGTTVSLSATTFGEGYANGGPIGWILACILHAGISFFLDRKFQEGGSNTAGFAGALGCAVAFGFRGDMVYAVWGLGMPFLIVGTITFFLVGRAAATHRLAKGSAAEGRRISGSP